MDDLDWVEDTEWFEQMKGSSMTHEHARRACRAARQRLEAPQCPVCAQHGCRTHNVEFLLRYASPGAYAEALFPRVRVRLLTERVR